MSLKYALLGQLKKREMTGYELKKFIDQSISHFWPTDHTQIYRLLNQLESQALIAATQEVQHSRPNRKRYQLTSKGEEELFAWLVSGQPVTRYKDAFLIQVFFAESIPSDHLVRLMEQHLAIHEEKLTAYDGIRQVIEGTAKSSEEKRLEILTLEFGIRLEEMHISWLKHAIAQLRDT